MSTSTTGTAGTTGSDEAVAARPAFRTANKVGLVLAGLLGAADISSFFSSPTAPGEVGPPPGILMLDGVLGLITLVAVVAAFVTRRRGWVRLTAGARICSMVTALPAFFAGVPDWLVAIVSAFVVLTVVTVVLMLLPTRRPSR
jgi:hypothetical protein